MRQENRVCRQRQCVVHDDRAKIKITKLNLAFDTL